MRRQRGGLPRVGFAELSPEVQRVITETTESVDTWNTAAYEQWAARQLSERQWEEQVVKWAREGGWLLQHTRTAIRVGLHYERTNDWRADNGYPDWTFARDSVLLFAELKREGTYPEPEQRAWMSALFPHGHHPELGYVWKPSAWEVVRRVLLSPPGQPLAMSAAYVPSGA